MPVACMRERDVMLGIEPLRLLEGSVATHQPACERRAHRHRPTLPGVGRIAEARPLCVVREREHVPGTVVECSGGAAGDRAVFQHCADAPSSVLAAQREARRGDLSARGGVASSRWTPAAFRSRRLGVDRRRRVLVLKTSRSRIGKAGGANRPRVEMRVATPALLAQHPLGWFARGQISREPVSISSTL